MITDMTTKTTWVAVIFFAVTLFLVEPPLAIHNSFLHTGNAVGCESPVDGVFQFIEGDRF